MNKFAPLDSQPQSSRITQLQSWRRLGSTLDCADGSAVHIRRSWRLHSISQTETDLAKHPDECITRWSFTVPALRHRPLLGRKSAGMTVCQR